jgi:cell division protein FtsQ
MHAVASFAWQRLLLRIALLAALIAIPLLGGGWLWFRQSSFVAVQHVQIVGVQGADAPAVEAALTRAAHGMSTLDVNAGALSAAVAQLRIVRSVRAIPRFPHGLHIEVSEQLPVASLTAAGVHTAVAADGVVLGPALLSGSLPTVSASTIPAVGHRVTGASLLASLTVLCAAPAPLAKHVERVFTGAEGLTVAMRNGLLVYFGDDSRPLAKWLSLARVLADSGSAGASYIDVRLPGRPAAGFPAGVTPPDASATSAATGAGSGEEQLANSESTIAALAAGLSSGTAAGTPVGAEPASSVASATGTPATGETESGATETAAPAEAETSQTSAAPEG